MDENVGSMPLDGSAEAGPTAATGIRERFSNMTGADYARDLLGVLAVIVSLQLPWSVAGGASAVPWALASILLLVVALVLPYITRLGAIPSSWTVHTTRRARVLLALPAVAAALAQVVLDALSVDGQSGVGAGVGMALTAAALAAVPRSSELGPRELDGAVTASWRNVTTLAGVLAVLAPVAWLALIVVQRLSVSGKMRDLDQLDGPILVMALATVLVVAALVVPAIGAGLKRSALWRRASVVVAATWAAALFAASDSSGAAIESVRTLVTAERGDTHVIMAAASLGYGLWLLGAVAVLATSPAVVRGARSEGDAAIGWFVTARGLLGLLGLFSALFAVATVLVALDENSLGLGALLPGAVIALVLGGLALKVRSMLVGRPADARRPALAATIALLGLGIVLVVVSRLDEAGSIIPSWHASLLALVVGVGLPVAVLVSLTVPAAVREHLAANPATPRPDGSTAAFVWQPRARALAASRPAPSAASAPSAPHGYPQHAPAPEFPASEFSDPSPEQSAPAPAPAGVQPVHSEPVHAEPVHSEPIAAQPVAPEVAVAPQAVAPEVAVAPQPAASASGGVPAGDQVTEVLRLDSAEASAEQGSAPVPDRSTRTEAGFTWATAVDPQTPATTLAQIAQDAPTLRAALALNPSTYPALVDWLGQLGDAEVNEALRSRAV
ncbi:DUF7937 domain-containing protein [Sanguibacter sp. A247]|uniref:DUF7937 domain-containing protein n=1 Tax=unclassified Sanguibacter TaxID=2645534 RepID=UPI003FD7B224